MLGVVLARFAGVMRGMRRVAMRRMCMVGGFFVSIRFVVLGRFAMMLCSFLVMVCGGTMMLDDLVLRHVHLLGWKRGVDVSMAPARA